MSSSGWRGRSRAVGMTLGLMSLIILCFMVLKPV